MFAAIRFGALLTSLALLASTADAQSTVAGCYDIQLGSWTPEMQLGADSLYPAPPPRILLDTLPGSGLLGRPTGFLLKPAPNAMPSIHGYSWWQRSGLAPCGWSGARVSVV